MAGVAGFFYYIFSDRAQEAVSQAPYELWRLISPRLREEKRRQKAFEKCSRQIKRMSKLVWEIKPCTKSENINAFLDSVQSWWSAIHSAIRNDNKLGAVPEFVQQHLDPIEMWLATFGQLAANKVAIAEDTLAESAAQMLPQFQGQLRHFYDDLHAADIAALETADAEIAIANPMLRKPLSKWARWNMGDTLRRYILFWPQRSTNQVPLPAIMLIDTALETSKQICESIKRNNDWSAAEPFVTQYLNPTVWMLSLYYRLKERQIKTADDVLADIENRVLPMCVNGLVAFHNQMHVHQIAALQTTDVELSASARPVARIEADAPASAEASA
jgi:hypothetical protein